MLITRAAEDGSAGFGSLFHATSAGNQLRLFESRGYRGQRAKLPLAGRGLRCRQN